MSAATPVGGVTPQDLSSPGTVFRIGVPPIAVDILCDIDGVDFGDAYARRVPVIIGAASGLQAPFISLDDLIANKLAAGRMQDLADVEALRQAGAAKPIGDV